LQFATTDLRPDIVTWHENPRETTLIELTVCFETTFEAAIQKKDQEFKEEAQNQGYPVQSTDYYDWGWN